MISPDELTRLLDAPPPEPEPEVDPDAPVPMNDADFESAAVRLVDRARDYMDDEILPWVRRSWRYYHGEVDATPMGFIGMDQGKPVYEGSRVVITECRDTTQALIPELYRVFHGVHEFIHFDPKSSEDVEPAEQATDYLTNLWWGQSEAERLLKDGLLDWMVKFCAYRVWWEPQNHTETYELQGLSDWALELLQNDQTLNSIVGETKSVQIWPQTPFDPATGTWAVEPQIIRTHDVTVERTVTDGKICIDLIPQEELLLDGDAQKLDQCAIIGTDCMRRVSDVVEMGIPLADVTEHASKTFSRAVRTDDVRRARENDSSSANMWTGSAADLATAWVRVVDVKVKIDRDGDGLAETHRVLLLGENPKVVDSRPDPHSDAIVVGSPYPIPHKIVGEGVVETMTDLQDQSTATARRFFDSFNRSINPRAFITSADEKVVDSFLEWFGGPIVGNQGDTINWLEVPFSGDKAFPMFEYIEQRRTLRTGISPAAQGLDPNALKGQTKEGGAAIVGAPQSRIDGFAREFAAGVMRPIFKALLKLSVQYQDKPATIRRRNQWVEVDPRSWNAEMDATPEVGLGTGTAAERFMRAQFIVAKQEQLKAEGSPFYQDEKYQTGLGDLSNALGAKDPTRYFPEFTAEELQQQAQQAQEAAEQQRQQALQDTAAIEQAKVQPRIAADVQKAQMAGQQDLQKAQLDAQKDVQKAQLDAQRGVQKVQADAAMDGQRMSMQHSQAIMEIQAQLAARLEAQQDKHMREMTELRLELQLELLKIRNKSPGGDANIAGAQ